MNEAGGQQLPAVEVGRRLVRGQTPIEKQFSDKSSPFVWQTPALEEITDGVWFIGAFANVTVVDTSEGLVFIDTGGPSPHRVFNAIKKVFPTKPLHTAIYTHGHVDHVTGITLWEKNEKKRARVVAHEGVVHRFDRYKQTSGYNGIINGRQFSGKPSWPSHYRYPDVIYEKELQLHIGNLTFDLHHALGETDDATWVWIPEKKVLCVGDMFIWAFPNCGNPQKVQRYPSEWAAALRNMASLGAEFMLPGHGPPIAGAEDIRAALTESAEALEYLVENTLKLMNEGLDLNSILQQVAVPSRLLDRPYLHPTYDEPDFIIRNIWRLYGGWYDGNPAHLKPGSDVALAKEVSRLSGGPQLLARRAMELISVGQQETSTTRAQNLALAGHLVEFAFLAEPSAVEIKTAYTKVNEARATFENSLMARGIFRYAAKKPAML